MYNTHSINGRSRAVAGVYGAPVQVLPVDPVCLICMCVLFIYLCYLHKFKFEVCKCPGTEN